MPRQHSTHSVPDVVTGVPQERQRGGSRRSMAEAANRFNAGTSAGLGIDYFEARRAGSVNQVAACRQNNYIVITQLWKGATAMKTALVRIGNSQGIRIPKAIIDQCGLEAEVEMSVRGDTVVIAPARKPRAGWAEAYRRMAHAGDDKLLIPDDLPNEFDEKIWRW